ncbi:uncharacterized protein Z518_05234 [Rhinocladiella mackenziei CBS 650.93]|uniref:Uncharacterized protein n=1 Tax=Rhinocladiella mackenziei CBS 650.93 TaxID=1442369 RepID=A0A0D2IMJ0_9EURO|nr:uncharacterized protein Z518_05234 [Rhinocladiella mackenziei CBS 650.93]KIX04366.1 hypothetical protein Z518_05234 [Rhinocladiella mackenziei CBS 650.93]
MTMHLDDEFSSKPEQCSATPARPPLFVAQLPLDNHERRRIQRVLIANRGEIACRIIATCRKLDLTSIALYADEDSTSQHVSAADEAIRLGSINQTEGNPFLNVQLLVKIAQSAKADAIHPGYGYLSENADFAKAICQAGMIFIGPSQQAMSTLGDKRNSKDYLRKHAPNIPLISGFSGSSQNVEDLDTAAQAIGFPVLLKASAGGGGRGMRIVRERSSLKDELARAQSEAKRSFGSSDCILEKYIEAAKHIEVQIVGDTTGKVISLWERECSVQRRYQKVIEETPSPFLTPVQRQEMCAAAVRIGELIGYVGAGTVEFVVDVKDGSFYFLEVNTRLQVEHPITEEVTGLDIVSLQLFVAAGGSFASLPALRQIPQYGHAIECRLCAEDPVNNFMPDHGTIRLWKKADVVTGSRDVRFETAVETDSTVSIHFDSMIAKIVVWAPTRAMAISKMVRVMANTVCAGVRTNQLFLQSCLLHSGFQDPRYTTSFIPTHLETLLKNPHSERAADMISMLSIVSGLVVRDNQFGSVPKPFRHVRRGFRNQPFDPVNLNTLVIVPNSPGLTTTPTLSVWTPSRAAYRGAHCVSLLPMSGTNDESENQPTTQATESATDEGSLRYNAISRKLRSNALSSAPQYEVELKKRKNINTTGDLCRSLWSTAFVEVSFNTSKVQAYIATDMTVPRADSSQTIVLCHFPALGTWIEYKCCSLLDYFSTLREAAVASATGSAPKSITAPMPCKVLLVLKKNGDEVKSGETVMVIESMKMETNVVIPAAGKFMTNVKQGAAVDDGEVLCWVD